MIRKLIQNKFQGSGYVFSTFVLRKNQNKTHFEEGTSESLYYLAIMPPRIYATISIVKNLQHNFPKMRGGGQRPFGIFPKIIQFGSGILPLVLDVSFLVVAKTRIQYIQSFFKSLAIFFNHIADQDFPINTWERRKQNIPVEKKTHMFHLGAANFGVLSWDHPLFMMRLINYI